MWNGPRGVAYRVFGPGADVLGRPVRELAEARIAAEKLVDNHGEWLGVSFADLREHHTGETDSTLILQYIQTHRGIPVADAIVAFIFNKNDGRLAMLGSEAVPGLTIDTKPKLTKRLKESFDPRRILNPGRMYEGV